MNKLDLRTCDWTDLPNGWTFEGDEIIRQNVDIIHQRIDEFIKIHPMDGSAETGKFLGKFYNRIGDPCPAFKSYEEIFFDLLLGN